MIAADPREVLDAHMMADVFDDYVNAPMQRIVGEALRKDEARPYRRQRDGLIPSGNVTVAIDSIRLSEAPAAIASDLRRANG